MPQIDFDLYLITDRHQCRNEDLFACVEAALRGGVKAVQLREKDLSTRERFDLGSRLRHLTSEFGARLLVNGDAALARAIGADGVQVPQDGLPAGVCRELLESDMLLGVSTHTAEEAREAEGGGADFITYGPVYYTPSKAGYGPPVGTDSLRAVCSTVELPVLALGGIKSATIGDVISTGAHGVAMISAILAASDVESAASGMVEGLRRARPAEKASQKEG